MKCERNNKIYMTNCHVRVEGQGAATDPDPVVPTETTIRPETEVE